MVKSLILLVALVAAMVTAQPPTNNPIDTLDPLIPPGPTICDGYNRGVYLRDPANCNRYFQCPYHRLCSAGLVFHQGLRACTFPGTGICDIPPPPAPGPSAPVGPGGPPPTNNPIIVIPNPRPPGPNICTGVPTGTYLSDPNDCTKFFQCPYHRACPAGLVFHQGMRVCTWNGTGIC